MNIRQVRIIFSALLVLGSPLQAADEAAASPADAPLLIVITGRYSGPQLWKVSNGAHVLWIFPYLSPVPKELEWDSAQVAQALAESQEYLPLPRFDMGGIPRQRLLNPDDKTLGDVLPAALYARYRALKSEYLPRTRSLEQLRPLIAGPSLASAIYRKKGLSGGDAILRNIDRLARRNHRLKRTAIRSGIADDVVQRLYVDNLDVISAEQEFACFEGSLSRVQSDVDILMRRANAWAEGDMETLRESFAILDAEDQDKSCNITTITDSAAEEELNRALTGQYAQQWMEAAETALANNASTVAVLNVGMLMDDGGILALLRNKGYSVREPD